MTIHNSVLQPVVNIGSGNNAEVIRMLEARDGREQLENIRNSNPTEFRRVLGIGIRAYIAGNLASSAMQWLHSDYAANIEKHIQAKREEHEEGKREKIRNFWREVREKATFSEADRLKFQTDACEAAGMFCKQFPQFIVNENNINKILRYVQHHQLAVEDPLSYETAFHEVFSDLELTLAPFGDNTILSGAALRNADAEVIAKLQSPPAQQHNYTPANEQSADEFLTSDPALAEAREKEGIPPIIIQQAKRVGAFFREKHPGLELGDGGSQKILKWMSDRSLNFDAQSLEAAREALIASGDLKDTETTYRSGHTTLIDHPVQQRTPAQSEKYSFRQLVNSMSATELQERCANDPKFREALDNL